jgi:hypothetical protein
MRRLPVLSLVALAGLLFVSRPSAARAEHAKIRLTVASKSDTSEAFDDDEPPIGGRDKRVIAKVKVDEPLSTEFILTNIYPHEIRKDCIVRYYVIRIDKVRQKVTPPLKDLKPANIIVQGQVQMNWKPKCQVGALFKFRLHKPGVYRVRVETANTKSDHEHFAAIDVIAE